MSMNDTPLAAKGAAHRAGDAPLLEIDGLHTYFDTLAGEVRSVHGVSYRVEAGQTVGVVGESGCGKSVTALSVMRLIQTPPGRFAGGAIRYRGTDLLKLGEAEMRGIRGNRISMIFQEPMTSLNPVFTVGRPDRRDRHAAPGQEQRGRAALSAPRDAASWCASPSRSGA
jgi:peptide/nickel transport system ATP-binding protein